MKVSKKNRKLSFLKEHFPAILSKIIDLSSLTWVFRDIATVIYGLQHKKANEQDAIRISSVMTTVIDKSMKNNKNMQSLKEQSISMLLYGLQNMTSDEKVIRDLLKVVALMIIECKDKFDAQEVGNVLYGLKGMSSDCSEVRDVLSSLAIKVRSCKEDLNAQAVGNALYGLKGMSSDCSEVRDVLASLATTTTAITTSKIRQFSNTVVDITIVCFFHFFFWYFSFCLLSTVTFQFRHCGNKAKHQRYDTY
jgi:hypothetical protein